MNSTHHGYDSSQFCILSHLHTVSPSFFKLDGVDFPAVVCMDFFQHVWVIVRFVSHNLFAAFHATPVGQASNPGPETAGFRLAICNPTAVYKKVDQLRKFDAHIIAASETSATNVIQKQVSKEFSGSGFRSFWSLPVAPKRATHDNRPSFRGEAVGSAVFTSLPARQIRCCVPVALNESQRFSACIIRFAQSEVLFICLYGFANRHREGKRPNDLLLASVIPIICEIGLPFVICGDFNEPVTKLPSYQFFRDLGAVEAFQWYFAKTGSMLPPTCGGSTRNDSAIIHPHVAEWICDMHVLEEHQIDMHTPLFIDFSCDKISEVKYTWRLPQTWAHFSPEKDRIRKHYKPIDFYERLGKHADFDADDLEDAFHVWSKQVEKAIDKAIAEEHHENPLAQCRKSLPMSCKGRCNFKKIFQQDAKPRVKSDRHGGYSPPTEVHSLRSRLKIRQVRRLLSLLRRYKTFPLDVNGHPADHAALTDAYREWQCILYAKGYGNCWMHWILSFEVVPALSIRLPTFELLEVLAQITQHDCDIACRDESNKRALPFKQKVHIDVTDDYSRMSYKIIRAKDTQSLSEVPVVWTTQFRLLRSRHGNTVLKIEDDFVIPAFAKLRIDDADLEFLQQDGNRIFFKHVSGNLPSSGILKISFVAITPGEIGLEFASYWSKMWMRDDRMDQFQDSAWDQLHSIVNETPMPLVPQITYPFACVKTWMKMIRKLPSGKATGPCG